MTEICTEIEIQAPAERVWQVLTDFAAYPHWNPVMQPRSGEPKVGAHLRVRVRLRRGLSVTLRITVLRAEANREVRWQGKLLFAGFFRGEHSFIIEPMAEGRVRFVQRETYSGWFTPVFLLFMRSINRRLFEDMNRALKARAEGVPLP